MRRPEAGQRLAIALLATALLIPVAPSLAQTAPPPSISVSGEATIEVPPDQAQIEAGVTTEAATARDASEANNATMGKLLLALKAAEVDDKDIQTSRISLQPRYNQNQNQSKPAVIIGYRASNQVVVRLRDIAKVASSIDFLVAAGATEIGAINFMVSNASKRLDDARAEAVADARRKAEIYAKAAGVTIGAPLSISEIGAPSQPGLLMRRMALPMTAGTPVPVAQGEQTLQVTVSVAWAIKPAGQ